MALPAQQQQPPGSEQEMNPKPDHGETSYTGSGKLEGKIAVITGADSGIGKAVAIAFAREGADVVVSYLDEHEDAAETEHWIQDAGRKALLIPGDLTDPGHCRDIIGKTVAEFGRVDVLVSDGSSIIGSSSMNSDAPNPTLLPYAMTKAGIANMTASLAQLLGPQGIRANSVAPSRVAGRFSDVALARPQPSSSDRKAASGERRRSIVRPARKWSNTRGST